MVEVGLQLALPYLLLHRRARLACINGMQGVGGDRAGALGMTLSLAFFSPTFYYLALFFPTFHYNRRRLACSLPSVSAAAPTRLPGLHGMRGVWGARPGLCDPFEGVGFVHRSRHTWFCSKLATEVRNDSSGRVCAQ